MKPNEMNNQQKIKRRDFLKILAVSGLAAGFGSKLIFELISNGEIPSHSETRLLMGTVINLTVISDDGDHLTLVVENTFSEMERLIRIFDCRLPDSEVGRLNQNGLLESPTPELAAVIEKAVQVAVLTSGRFDITIKPVITAFQHGKKITEDLKSLVDYRFIKSSADQIWFEREGVQITLDGIAKGAVIDAGAAVLRGSGFNNVLVEAGGDLMATGNRSGDPWRIGLKHPRDPERVLITTLGLKDQAAATSGDYQNYFSDDFAQHHIIDPEVFESPKELASVTVLAPSALEADAFSTAIMVMGAKGGLMLVEKLPSIEAFLVTKDQLVIKSSGFSAE